MTWQKTTATSLDDVAAQIATFAVANAGFTNSGTITVGGKTVQRLLKGTIYYYFGMHSDGVGSSAYAMRYKMGYALGAAWPTTGNGPQYESYMTAQAFAGPYPNLYLFTEGTCVHCVLELATGIFNHFSFGKLTKTDTFDGGEFMTAGCYAWFSGGIYQSWNYSINGNRPPWFNNGTSTVSIAYSSDYILQRKAVPFNDYRDFAAMGRLINGICAYSNANFNGLNDALINRSPSNATQRTVMLTNYVFLYDNVSGLWKPAGYVPGMRAINLRNLDAAEVIYTNWQCFPWTQHNGNSVNICNSGEYGVAYQQ